MIIHLAHSEPIGTAFITKDGHKLYALACPLYCLH